jgi:hypothetical protein
VTWLTAAPLGAGDCEAIRAAFLTQPSNALSSLAYLVAGAFVLARGRERGDGHLAVAGGLLVAVGGGSFLYHGPAPAGARLAHDATIAAMLGFLAWWSGRNALPRWGWPAAAVVTGTLLALVPDGAGLVLVFVGAGAASLVARRLLLTAHRGRLVAIAAVTAVAGGLALLGSTGAAWCAPRSVLQAHAGWHVLGAAALTMVAAALGAAPRAPAGDAVSS